MSEGKKLIQIGKKELLSWANSLLGQELTWKNFSDGELILKLCFIVWPSLKNMKTEINTLSDPWKQIEAIFRTLGIEYSKLIDEDGIKNEKLCSIYNALIIFFFLYHCAFKKESSFEFIPSPSKQIADFLMGDSSVKTLIVGGSLQLSPKTQIRLFENDSKNNKNKEHTEFVRCFKGDEGTYYDRVQRFNEVMEMDERTVKLVDNLNEFFEGLNKKLYEISNIEPSEFRDRFNTKIRHSLEYCVRQLIRTKEEQAIERVSYENRIKVMEEEFNKKIEQIKHNYEDKIREIEYEGKQRLIQEKKASQSMLRTLQNNQTLNLQISHSVCKSENKNELDSEQISDVMKNEFSKQLKYLQEIVKEENKKRDEIEKVLNEEIKNYQNENKKLRYIIYTYIVDVSTNTPQYERLKYINDQFVKIYIMAENWWRNITETSENCLLERTDLNYKMERIRVDEVLGHIKHILDKYQEYPKTLNQVGLNQSKNNSSFEIEVLVQNSHLVNDCLKIVCDLISESLLKSNHIEQLKDVIMNYETNNEFTEHNIENVCYCNSKDIFGNVYGKIICNDEKKQLKEKVQHLNNEKLLLQRGIEFLKKKLYTIKNQKIILSSESYENNLNLMTNIDEPLVENEINKDNIVEVNELWDISNYLKEDGVNELNIMSEFLVIINRWKKLLEENIVDDASNLQFKQEIHPLQIENNGMIQGNFSIQDSNIIPFITSSNKLIEMALENEVTHSELFEDPKRLMSNEFYFENDFEKEIEMISRIASYKEFHIKNNAEFINFPSSLKNIEILFWKLVISLHILREEYSMIHNHCSKLEKKIEVIVSVMENEKDNYKENIRKYQEKCDVNLKNERNQQLKMIGKLKGEIALKNIEKMTNISSDFKVFDDFKTEYDNQNKIIQSLSIALEVSNVYRFIYEVCDNLWNELLYIIVERIQDDELSDKISDIRNEMKGLKEYLKEYTEQNMHFNLGNNKKEDIAEYVSSKIMEIRDNYEINNIKIDDKICGFLKDLAIKNNIPLDWLQFIELLVNTKTIELNRELKILNNNLNQQKDLINNLRQKYENLCDLNNQNESVIEQFNLEYKLLEEKLKSSGEEIENLKLNNQLFKKKLKELDLYYTTQLMSSNKRLNFLEKICLLGINYGINIQHFKDIYFNKIDENQKVAKNNNEKT